MPFEVVLRIAARGQRLGEVKAHGPNSTPAARQLHMFMFMNLREPEMLPSIAAACWDAAQLKAVDEFECVFLPEAEPAEFGGSGGELRTMLLALCALQCDDLGGHQGSGRESPWFPADGRIRFRKQAGGRRQGFEIFVGAEGEDSERGGDAVLQVSYQQVLALLDCLDVFGQLVPQHAIGEPSWEVAPVACWRRALAAVQVGRALGACSQGNLPFKGNFFR